MKQLLVLFFVLLSVCAQSQKTRTTTLDLADIESTHRTSIPFSAIEVMDVRFDRSNIGCVNEILKANGNRIKYTQAIASFPDSLHRYLSQLLHKLTHLDKESKDTLVLLVKQFRVAECIANSINLQLEPEVFVRLSLSAFSRKDNGLRKIFSIDDLLSKKIPTDRILKQEVMSDYRKEALVSILQDMLQGKAWQSNGTIFPILSVQDGIRKRFVFPLLTDTFLRAGVYKNFQEFKENAPSLINVHFEINKDKVVGVVDPAGKPVDVTKYWGICSGTKQYIVFRNELCELTPSDRSFSFSSFTQPSDLSGRPGFGDYLPQTGLLGAAFIKGAENRAFRRLFYLNMDEGAVYLEDVFGRSTLKQMEKELLK